jgi:hypothetical protein
MEGIMDKINAVPRLVTNPMIGLLMIKWINL